MVRRFGWSAGVAVVVVLCGFGVGAGIAGAGAGPASDQSVVEKAALTQADFPTDGGWSGESYGRATQDVQDKQDSDLAAFAPCAALRTSYRRLYGAPATATTLYQNDSGSTADLVVMLETPKNAATVVAAYRSAKTAECFKQYWASLYDASSNAKLTVVKLPGSVTKAAGGTTGVRLKSEYLLNGTPTVTYFDFLAIAKGRGAGAFTFSHGPEPFPAAFEAKLLNKVAGRLPK